MFGRCLQSRYIFALDVTGPAWRYHGRADETNASSGFEEAAGGMHGGGKNAASNKKMVSQLGSKSYIGRFCWKFKRFRLRDRNFIVAPRTGFRRG